MGAHIDVAAVLAAASRFDAGADSLEGAARMRAMFGAASAGRAHAAHGEAVRAVTDGLSDDIRAWARAGAEIASALRTSAVGYVAAEARSEARLA